MPHDAQPHATPAPPAGGLAGFRLVGLVHPRSFQPLPEVTGMRIRTVAVGVPRQASPDDSIDRIAIAGFPVPPPWRRPGRTGAPAYSAAWANMSCLARSMTGETLRRLRARNCVPLLEDVAGNAPSRRATEPFRPRPAETAGPPRTAGIAARVSVQGRARRRCQRASTGPPISRPSEEIGTEQGGPRLPPRHRNGRRSNETMGIQRVGCEPDEVETERYAFPAHPSFPTPPDGASRVRCRRTAPRDRSLGRVLGRDGAVDPGRDANGSPGAGWIAPPSPGRSAADRGSTRGRWCR